MVRKKNVLATMAQSLAAVMIVSILWVAFGYSLAFVGDGPWLGNLDRWFLTGMTMDSVNPAARTIPEALFMLYQMTFAIITVALVAGSVADRMRFSAYLLFSVTWFMFVYVPLAHWVWGGGFLGTMGVLDFAGGVGGASLRRHRRAGRGKSARPPAGLWDRKSLAVRSVAGRGRHRAVVGRLVRLQRRLGAVRLAARGDGDHRHASGASAGALVWGGIEWYVRRKPSVLGMISGAVAGLGTITPASGFVAPWHGIIIGAVAGAICYWACTWLKQRFKYDDSLDVFGVHGVGGMTGTILCGVFATSAIGGTAGLIEGHPQQLLIQLYGVAVTLVWSAGMTYALLKLVSVFVPLRVSREHEMEGLDISQHGEALQ
jgi:Amt family ammonium transporter